MPNEEFWLEALKRPEHYAIFIAVLGLFGSFYVILALVKIIKHRESGYESLLGELEKVAACQGKLIRASTSIYLKILEISKSTGDSTSRS